MVVVVDRVSITNYLHTSYSVTHFHENFHKVRFVCLFFTSVHGPVEGVVEVGTLEEDFENGRGVYSDPVRITDLVFGRFFVYFLLNFFSFLIFM